MEKKVTISNNSKIVAFFDELSKKKEHIRAKLTAKILDSGNYPNSHSLSKIER